MITLTDRQAERIADVLKPVVRIAPPKSNESQWCLNVLQRKLDDDFYPFPPELRLHARSLFGRTAELYEFNANDRGKGNEWERGPARWHFYKAHDELSTATHHAKSGESYYVVRDREADALNHMIMALGKAHRGERR